MAYPEMLIAPMRGEMTAMGAQELRTPQAVDEAVKNTRGTLMLVVNSVCGCAAGKAPEWGRSKREEYTAKDYHAPSDQVKPDWDLSGAAEDAQLLLAVGYRVANADRLPEWKPGNEFKAKRDAMLKK